MPFMLWINHFGITALALFAPVGLLILGCSALIMHSVNWKDSRPWLMVWFPMLIPLPFQLVAGNSVSWLLLQFLLIVTASFILQVRTNINLGLSIALLLTIMGMFAFWQQSSEFWLDSDSGLDIYRVLTKTSLLEARQQPYQSFGKTWQTYRKSESLSLSFEARALRLGKGGGWYVYNPKVSLENFIDEMGDAAVRVNIPTDDDSARYISREMYLTEPLAERTFRAHITLRASQDIITAGCNGIVLQENGGHYRGRCLPINLTAEWQTFEVIWYADETVTTHHLRLLLNNINVPYEVKKTILEELKDGQWVELNPLEPAGVVVRPLVANVRRQNLPSYIFVPEANWMHYQYDFDFDVPDDLVTFLLQLEYGTVLELRNIRLTDDASSPVQATTFSRVSMWFPQANLAGHSIALLGLIILSVQQGARGFIYLLVCFFGIYLTGSRTALLAFLIAGPILVMLNSSGKERRFIFLLMITSMFLLSLLTITGKLQPSRIFVFDDTNTVTRYEIWQLAWGGVLSNPWTGFGEGDDSFLNYWKNHSDAPTQAVNHTHNFWLQFAFNYGFPGLLAGIWVVLALVMLAWQRGRWLGVIPVLAVLFMNSWDYTLLFSGIIFLLILHLNSFIGFTRLCGHKKYGVPVAAPD